MMTKEELLELLEPYDDLTPIKLGVDFRTDDAESVTSNEDGEIVITN